MRDDIHHGQRMKSSAMTRAFELATKPRASSTAPPPQPVATVLAATYYLRYAQRSEMRADERVTFDLITDIEKRYLAGTYRTSKIPYDPSAEGLVGRHDDAPKGRA